MKENVKNEFMLPSSLTATAMQTLMSKYVADVALNGDNVFRNSMPSNGQLPFIMEQNSTCLFSMKAGQSLIGNLDDVFFNSNKINIPSKKVVRRTVVETNSSYPVVANVKMDENTKKYVEQNGLIQGVNWLNNNVAVYFPCLDCELELLSSAEDDESLLTLMVYGRLDPSVFLEKMFAICEAMTSEGYDNLREVIGIIQRSICPNEREGFSDNSSYAIAA